VGFGWDTTDSGYNKIILRIYGNRTMSLNDILALVKPLDTASKRQLIDEIKAMVSAEHLPQPTASDTAWTQEEIEAVINPQPKTGAEIIAAGLTGTWQHLSEQDTVEWLNARKSERRQRRQW
jgi:hypothetical protein